MADTSTSLPTDAPGHGTASGPGNTHTLFGPAEGFWGAAWRRSRYVVCVLLSAMLFVTWGWKFAAPPPQMAGVSLLAWHNHDVITAVALTALLILAGTVSSIVVYPDSPHAGLFCALLGMMSLSIRGGTAHGLIQDAQQHGTMAGVSQLLALECVEWAVILLVAEFATRWLHDKFLSNTHWLTRSAEVGKAVVVKSHMGYAVGASMFLAKFFHTDKIQGWLRVPLAMVWSGACAYLMLYLLLQSQAKGQVILACFVSLWVSTMCASNAFPRVPLVAMILVAPLAPAVGFLIGMHDPMVYPGHVTFFAMRTLPIDYVAAGAAGVIVGYYWVLHWSVDAAMQE